jgi:hypothetical protein
MLNYSNRVFLTANILNYNGFYILIIQEVGLNLECLIKISPIDLKVKVFIFNSFLLLLTTYNKHIIFNTNFTFERDKIIIIIIISTYSNSI